MSEREPRGPPTVDRFAHARSTTWSTTMWWPCGVMQLNDHESKSLTGHKSDENTVSTHKNALLSAAFSGYHTKPDAVPTHSRSALFAVPRVVGQRALHADELEHQLALAVLYDGFIARRLPRGARPPPGFGILPHAPQLHVVDHELGC